MKYELKSFDIKERQLETQQLLPFADSRLPFLDFVRRSLSKGGLAIHH